MAVITNKLKKILAQDLKDDFDSAGTYYYVGLGRSELWNDSDIVPDVDNSYREATLFRYDLQGVKLVDDAEFVVPRNNWVAGTIYSAYDDNTFLAPENPYYVITQSNQIYVCVQQGKNALGQAVPSVVEPTSTAVTPQTLSDGYTWKFLYSISAFEANRFLAANWMPVTIIDSSDGSFKQDQQIAVQNAAIPGEILSIVVTNGGTGYSSAPTITITGNGDSAEATATISGGSVVKVEMTNRGSGYTAADVEFSSGDATARAVLSPINGLGADPRDDLRSTSLMFNGRPDGDEGGKLPIDQDFRQIGLLRGLTLVNTDSDFTASAGIALRKLTFQGGATPFTIDNIVVGQTSGAKGVIDITDSAAGLWYHQNETTGFRNFVLGEPLVSENTSGATVAGSAILDSDLDPDFNKYSGQVLYIDNRTSITRSSGETQDIKIIVKL